MNAVTIFGRADCGSCTFTKRAFELARLRHVVIDVDQDADGAAIARELAAELGRSELPIVLCEDGSRWAGLRLDLIARLVRAV